LLELITLPSPPNEAIDCTIRAVESDDGKLAAVEGEGVADPITVPQRLEARSTPSSMLLESIHY
jgi:hypothetical protein